MKILIVDDFAKMREVIMRMLTNLSAEFIECDNGLDALYEYEHHHPEYVLMDIEMKEMDGIAVTRSIINKHPDAQIIMVTNYKDQRLIDAARKAGAIGYVMKENLNELRKYFQ